MNARDVLDLVWLVPALPLAGAVFLGLFGRRIREPLAGWLATGLLGLSFAWSVVTFAAMLSLPGAERQHVRTIFTWFASGTFQVHMGFLVDPLSVTWIMFVTGVGTLIHLYSIGYMHGDARFSRFFCFMNFFAAAMTILVLGSSFLVTFMGFEGVGLASYLLIGFWFERNSAAVAGKKAFVTTRVGDVGFMIGMFLIFDRLGSLDYSAMNAGAAHLANGTATAIALLLFAGAVGKSAQIPLHIWLPDAMEGPTPVSALIHAAAMVTAGVFLVARAYPFFEASTVAPEVVAWVGAITALLAGAVALVQPDIKRVLAYSTISQLGYMFLALGVGAYGAAVFHVVIHAFFKATLFLGAGTVIHGTGDNQDMRTMGGLRRFLPLTALGFMAAWLAIAGMPPFSGFWSKDEILAKAFASHNYGVWILGILGALLTGLYMTREVWLVFFGNERFHAQVAVDATPQAESPAESTEPAPELAPVFATPTVSYGEPPRPPGNDHPHEGSPTMVFAVVVLGALSLVGGVLSLPFHGLEFLTDWLQPSFRSAHPIPSYSFLSSFGLSTLTVVVGLVGILVAVAMYRGGLRSPDRDPLDERLGVLGRLFGHAFYFDEALARAVDVPIRRGVEWLSTGFDKGIIDGAVNGCGRLFRGFGDVTRKLQTGLVRQYALGIAAGAAALLIYVWARTL